MNDRIPYCQVIRWLNDHQRWASRADEGPQEQLWRVCGDSGGLVRALITILIAFGLPGAWNGQGPWLLTILGGQTGLLCNFFSLNILS